MKKISIRFTRPGSKIQTIELSKNSLVSDLKNKLSITRKGGCFYRKGSKLNLNTVLKDKDIIIYAFSIRGEATVRRNGKVWKIHKNDPDLLPSDFHAHNYDDNETLDLYTGFLYKTNTRDKIAKFPEIDYKALLELLSKSKEALFKEKANKILNESFSS